MSTFVVFTAFDALQDRLHALGLHLQRFTDSRCPALPRGSVEPRHPWSSTTRLRMALRTLDDEAPYIAADDAAAARLVVTRDLMPFQFLRSSPVSVGLVECPAPAS